MREDLAAREGRNNRGSQLGVKNKPKGGEYEKGKKMSLPIKKQAGLMRAEKKQRNGYRDQGKSVKGESIWGGVSIED